MKDQLWITVSSEEFPDGRPEDHLFAGYYLPFPEHDWGRRGEGFVSTISDDPPQLNWIYVDKDTYEVKYGLRAVAEQHIVGPWDVTKIDRRVTLEGWEGFIAVKYGEADWALYFDRDEDGLKYILGPEFKRVSVELVRKELKQKKLKPEGATEEENSKKIQEMASKKEDERRNGGREKQTKAEDGTAAEEKLTVLKEMVRKLEEERLKKAEEKKPKTDEDTAKEEKLGKVKEMVRRMEEEIQITAKKKPDTKEETTAHNEEGDQEADKATGKANIIKGQDQMAGAADDKEGKSSKAKKKPRKLEIRH